jgi:hypothetical protein
MDKKERLTPTPVILSEAKDLAATKVAGLESVSGTRTSVSGEREEHFTRYFGYVMRDAGH